MKWTKYHTAQDALDAYAQLTNQQRLLILARLERHSKGSNYDSPADLFHEVLHRMLKGKRSWPVGVEFTTFVVNAGQSVVSSEWGSGNNSNLPLDSVMDWKERGEDGPSPLAAEIDRAMSAPSAEDEALRRERMRILVELQIRTSLVLAKDAVAKKAADGYLEGKSLSELGDELGLDAKTMSAASQRAQRAFRRAGRDMKW
ncbi:hypothetical protein SNE35_25800 [Paucibacter sp. R3-3]|uniref:Sigma-70 family RNA polymerase sigma factor n=1 Tax=Roseateles agri TaxID=3098619 RepID=A0ABU5DSC1_9BURK|nr:hypothetical protein [Paucibacter sp. R3-3]MDY0747942.1 hypothetical protein [Paucibacter sp. R3-3]